MDFSLIASHFAALLNEIKKIIYRIMGIFRRLQGCLFNTGFKITCSIVFMGCSIPKRNNTNLLETEWKARHELYRLIRILLQQSQNASFPNRI